MAIDSIDRYQICFRVDIDLNPIGHRKVDRVRVANVEDHAFALALGAVTNTDDFDYAVSTTYTKPGVFNPDTDFSANVFAKSESHDTYDEESVGGSLNLVYYKTDQLTLSGGVFGAASRTQDFFGTREFITAGLEGDVLYDNRDNKLDPSKGIYAQFNAMPFYEWEYSNPGVRFEAEGRTYYSVDSDKHTILAGRLKLGSVIGKGIPQSNPGFLFTAGGGNSVRGYAYKSIGVTNAAGQETAGKSLLESSFEVRQRLFGNFGAVGFIDAGVVGPDSWVDFSEDVRVGVGGGVRYYTGLGPIRVDVAFPLNKTSGDPDFALYAGIGQAF